MVGETFHQTIVQKKQRGNQRNQLYAFHGAFDGRRFRNRRKETGEKKESARFFSSRFRIVPRKFRFVVRSAFRIRSRLLSQRIVRHHGGTVPCDDLESE